MKIMKWICRYAFLGLLLAGALFWGIYCQIAILELEAPVHSLDYVDLAVSLSPEALALLERIDQFEQLRNGAVIAAAVVVLCLGVLIVFQILCKKLTAKKTVGAVQIQPSEGEPVNTGAFCRKCGQHYDQMPVFCVRCGNKFES